MIWNRISFEDHLPPSLDALERHWQWSVWVMDYWEQSCSDNIILLPLRLFGWKENGTDLEIDWDSLENIDSVKEGVTFLLVGVDVKQGVKQHVVNVVKIEYLVDQVAHVASTRHAATNKKVCFQQLSYCHYYLFNRRRY